MLDSYIQLAIAIIAGLTLMWYILSYCLTPKNVRNARKEIKNKAKIKTKEFNNEALLLNMQQNQSFYKRNFFDKSITIQSQNDKKEITINSLKNSFVITGEAGCGKSSVLKEKFRKDVKQYRKYRKNFAVFFDAAELHKEILISDSFLNLIKDASLPRITVYLDGIDETIDNLKKFTDLLDKLNNINLKTKKLTVRISCRPDFLNIIMEPLNSYNFAFYEIKTWDSDKLKAFSLKILKSIKSYIEESYNDIVDYFKSEVNWLLLGNSPLMCKMLISIKIANEEYELSNNKFEFYSSFIQSLLKLHYQKNNIAHDIEKDINNLAKRTFDSYYSGNVHSITCDKEFQAFDVILKKHSTDNVFKHETFYEYFVAQNFINYVFDFSNGFEKVLSCEYTNNIADFITDALFLEDTMKCIKNFVNIYSCTFSTNVYSLFKKQFSSLQDINIYNQTKQKIKSLSINQFFKLKYTIIFRLGRLGTNNDKIIDFLEFVYFEDENICNSKSDDFDEKYNLIVLRRCCAISSSFLGGENIELDYISHMLPYDDEKYILDYDLVNRSHTLVYYGDVITQENDVINFKDDGSYSCKKSCAKRLKRLGKLMDNKKLSEMSFAEKRLFYFRVFDIATIYTFLVSRNKGIYLTEEEKEVLRNFNTDFEEASEKRIQTLETIKKETIKFLNEKV